MVLVLVMQEVYLRIFSTEKHYSTSNQKHHKKEHMCLYVLKGFIVSCLFSGRGENNCQEAMSSLKMQILHVNIVEPTT